MILKKADEKNMDSVKSLYERAFPDNERKPFGLILENRGRGLTDILALEDEALGGDLKGIVITINHKDMVLVDYFAVEDTCRGQGIGGKAIELIREKYAKKRVFLEIELPGEGYENNAQRVRRKAFYLKNGLKESGIQVRVYGTDMELLTFGAPVSFEEYREVFALAAGEGKETFIEPEII